MAIHYVDDSKTSGADDGTSWDDSFLSITSAASAVGDGDLIVVSSQHDETLSGHTYIGGTVSDPVTIVSATSGSDPATYATGATFRGWTASKAIRPGTNKFVSWWGCSMHAEAANYDDLKLGMSDDSAAYFFECTFTARDQLYLTTSNDSYTKHTGCSYEILASASAGGRYIYQSGTASTVDIRDGHLINSHKDYSVRRFYGGTLRMRGCDLSGFSEGYNDGSTSRTGPVQISGCSVGSGFSAGTADYASKVGGFTSVDYSGPGTYGTSDAVTGLIGALDYYGKTTHDASRYRAGGAKDSISGGAYCHAIICQYGTPTEGHNSCELVARVDGGSEVTATVCLSGSDTLTDEEFWIDWFCPSEGSTARQHFASSRKSNPLATATELTADTSSWTGSGVGTKYRVSLTWTPVYSGLIFALPVFAKSSSTVYLDPKITVS